LQTNTNTNMETKRTSGNSSGILKVVVALLGVGILGLGYYTYDMYNESQETQQILQAEKEQVINELEDLKVNYDQAIQEKTEVSEKLEEAKTRIESLIEEVKKTKKINASIIRRYKKEIAMLKAQRDELYKIADSLRAANMNLIVEKDSLSSDLEKQKQFNDTLLNKNEQLAQTLNKAKILYPTNLKATGVKIRNSGKIIETSRRRRAQQIRVCFTIPQNDILDYGNQTFYVKVVNPNGDVIGSNDVVSVGDNQLMISAKEDIVYENKALDVCIFVKPQDKDKEIVKGEYLIEVYHNGNKVGTTNLLLK